MHGMRPMEQRIKKAFAQTAPLAAAGMACVAAAVIFAGDPPAPASVTLAAPTAVEHCKRAAYLLYDITWAAVCQTTADDSNDCTLPEEQAAKVNAVIAAEESRCMAEA